MKFSHGQMWKLSHLSECDSFYSDCLYSSSNLRIESGNGLFLACLLWVIWFSKRMPEGLPEIVPQASPSLRVPKWPNLENILKGKNVYVWYVSHLICLLCWICCGDPSWWGRAEYATFFLMTDIGWWPRATGKSMSRAGFIDRVTLPP